MLDLLTRVKYFMQNSHAGRKFENIKTYGYVWFDFYKLWRYKKTSKLDKKKEKEKKEFIYRRIDYLCRNMNHIVGESERKNQTICWTDCYLNVLSMQYLLNDIMILSHSQSRFYSEAKWVLFRVIITLWLLLSFLIIILRHI